MSEPKTLTVVMPVYNEEEAIAQALDDVRGHVLDVVPNSDCLVIDDGSTDSTRQILATFTEQDPRIRVIRQENSGHGRALRQGLEQAQGEWLFLLDSDRQIPLEAFKPLWKSAKTCDAAFGVRAVRHDPKARVVLSKVIALTLRLMFGVRLRDANVPFKVIRRSIWLEARDLIPEGTLAPSLFLAVFARYAGRDVLESVVPHHPRRTGVGSLRPVRLVKFCAQGFVQMIAYRIRLGRMHRDR